MKWWTPRMARGLRRSFLPTVVENFSVCRRREGGKSSVNCPNCWIGVCLHSASIRFPLFRMWNYRIVVGSLVRQKRRTPPETWRAYFLLNIKFSEAAWWCSPSTCITCVALNLSGAGRRRWCLPYLYQTSTRTHSGWLLFVYVFWRHKASRMQREIKTKKTIGYHSLLHFHCRRTHCSLHEVLYMQKWHLYKSYSFVTKSQTRKVNVSYPITERSAHIVCRRILFSTFILLFHSGPTDDVCARVHIFAGNIIFWCEVWGWAGAEGWELHLCRK